jgi:hypothetical protein
MSEIEQKWSPGVSLEQADAFIKNLAIPVVGEEVTTEYGLDFTNLMNADNKELERFLTMYGGYKAYLETELSGVTATKTALEAAFNEKYSTAIYTLAEDREQQGKKRLTREEVRGAAFSIYPGLIELRKQIIDQEAIYIRVSGLLNAYKSAYDAVSRIVTLRNLGRDNTKSWG